MDWKFAAVIAVVLLSASALAVPAAANGDDGGKGWRGGKWDKDWDKWDKDRFRDRGGFYGGGWGGFPAIIRGYQYPVAYPVGYPLYIPANYGYDQGACFQACVNSGQYPPEVCGRMCYYA